MAPWVPPNIVPAGKRAPVGNHSIRPFAVAGEKNLGLCLHLAMASRFRVPKRKLWQIVQTLLRRPETCAAIHV